MCFSPFVQSESGSTGSIQRPQGDVITDSSLRNEGLVKRFSG